jgi:N-acetylglucosaminyl-diphospho-decaprenol L-rhamnosyltransferase
VARDLTISIVNHSNPEMLRDCLRSIYAGTKGIEFEIRVVDNATGGGLVDEIRVEFPELVWLFNERRMGFSSNHNQVLASARSRYLCILNDDTIVYAGAMEALVRFMDENAAVGMVGPRTLNGDGSIQNSTFCDKTLFGELLNLCLLPGKLNGMKLGGIDSAQYKDVPANVDWLLGSCILVRESALTSIGLLDDVMSPVANCEEVDWCLRARKAGWDVTFVPSAKITHLGGQSLKSESSGADRFRVEMHRAILAFFRKHRGIFATIGLRAIYVGTLPWNGLMLGQSVLRKRTDKNEAKRAWHTLLGIAGVGLRRLPTPYCTPMLTSKSSRRRARLNRMGARSAVPAGVES